MFSPELIILFKENTASLMLVAGLLLLRPLGMTLGFIVFTWALPPVSLIRAGVALVLALPLFYANGEKIIQYVKTNTMFDFGMLSIREVAIGYILGFLASVPFMILQTSGAFIDSYRGESNAMFQDPTGGTVSTYSRLFLVAGFIMFAATGGPLDLVKTLYKTYEFIPLFGENAQLTIPEPKQALSFLDHLFGSAVIIAAPLLFLMLFVDFAALLAGRLARGFNPNDLAFALRNLLSLLAVGTVLYVALSGIEKTSTNFETYFGGKGAGQQ